MAKKLILIEGKEDIKNLEKQITDESIVVCFDYESHEKLSIKNLKHNKLDDYLSNVDEEHIDQKAVELTTNWYNNDQIKKYLEYDGINLGKLLEIELIWYFFEYTKRIGGIIKILEKEKPNEVIVSFLSNCVEAVCKNSNIKIQKFTSKKTSSLFFDNIEIPVKINGKIIPIKISRKNFLRVRKIFNKFINILFKIKPNKEELQSKKSILLLDYNISIYDELIKELSKSEQNVLLLNQRRPAVWNLSSLKNLKNSKCKVVELSDFIDDSLKLQIQQKQKKLEGELNKLWNNDEVFNEIISFKNYSFWNAIKENFIQLTTKRFTESVEKLVLLNELFNTIDISVILEWAHVGLEDKLAINVANKNKIPNLFLQHGLYLQNEKFDKYLPILPILPSNNSKHLVWGQTLENYIIEKGGNLKQVIKIGSPRYDKFFREHQTNKKFNTILLAANGFFHINCKGTDIEAFIRMENYVKKILETVKKYPDKKIIVKLHPGKVSYDIKPLIQKIDPTIEIFQNENILDLLEKSDVMISLNYSTVVLDALILEKPSLILLPEEQNFENEIPLKNKTVLITSKVEEIEIMIKNLLEDKKIQQELIKNGKRFVDEYIVNQGDSSKKLADILEDYE